MIQEYGQHMVKMDDGRWLTYADAMACDSREGREGTVTTVHVCARDVWVGDMWPAVIKPGDTRKTVVLRAMAGRGKVNVEFDDGTVWTYHHAKKIYLARKKVTA